MLIIISMHQGSVSIEKISFWTKERCETYKIEVTKEYNKTRPAGGGIAITCIENVIL